MSYAVSNAGATSRSSLIIFGASVAIMALQPFFLHLAEARSSREEKMGPDSFMLAAEVMKMIVSAIAIVGCRAFGLETTVWCGIRHTVAFAVPAAIYLFMNIMKVFAARELAPPIFQLLASCKILATALTSWAILNRQLSSAQWAAMLLLSAGVALGRHSPDSGDAAIAQDVPILPTVIMVVNAFVSATGAVYTERVLKANQNACLSVFATNLHMSAHTLLMNVVKAGLYEVPEIPRPWHFGLWTWGALANEAVNGILVSALMRHADSIVKNYAFGTSIFATAILSVPLLGFWPQFSFFLGAGLVFLSMYVYAKGGSLNNHASNGHAKKVS